jgi:hypothetical protein
MINVRCTAPVTGWNLVGENVGDSFGSVEAQLIGTYSDACWAWRILNKNNFCALITDAGEAALKYGYFLDGEWNLVDTIEGVDILSRWRVSVSEDQVVTISVYAPDLTEVITDDENFVDILTDGTWFGVGFEEATAGLGKFKDLVINDQHQHIVSTLLPPEGGPIVGPPLRSQIAP